METNNNKILLGHGSGGKLTHELIRNLFAKFFANKFLSPLSDSANLTLSSKNIAFTTDSYVVDPLIFPGGDIGKLAICGTVNDLAVSGAKPEFISCGFIIEEGLEFELLEEIVVSMANTAKEAGVQIVTGDTKVVGKGSADKLFINTSGIGTIIERTALGLKNIVSGDVIIVNGTIGDHGMAILAAREGLNLKTELKSDCAALGNLIETLVHELGAPQDIKFMRDPTRGGLATTLCEIAESTGLDIEIDEKNIPLSKDVIGISEILGIDPLFSANEGKAIFVVSPNSASKALEIIQKHPLGKNAKMIGVIKESHTSKVHLRTAFGTTRQLMMLTGEQLPRIC